MNLKRTIITALSIFLGTASTAAAQAETCNALLNHGISNVMISSNQYDYLTTVRDTYCQESYESMSADKKGSFNIVVKSIPVGLSGSSADAKTKHTNFCRDFTSLTRVGTASYQQTQEIYSAALDAWNKCQGLVNQGLLIEPIVGANKTFVTFNMRVNGGGTFKFKGVDVDGLDCSINGKKQGASEDRTLSAAATVMTCNRASRDLSIEGTSAAYFRPARVVVKTTQGPAIVQFVEMINGAARSRLDRLEALLAGTRDDLGTLNSSLAIDGRNGVHVQNVDSPGAVSGDWSGLNFCPAGTYVTGVAVRDIDTGSKCTPCISQVRVSCSKITTK